jgi:hypothetical protein
VFYILAVHGLVTCGKSQVNIGREAAATGLFVGDRKQDDCLGGLVFNLWRVRLNCIVPDPLSNQITKRPKNKQRRLHQGENWTIVNPVHMLKKLFP